MKGNNILSSPLQFQYNRELELLMNLLIRPGTGSQGTPIQKILINYVSFARLSFNKLAISSHFYQFRGR